MQKINKSTGEIIKIEIRGLWSHFPIPAYQVLAEQKEWSAQRLLSCLVSFLGSDGLCVYPSYRTISRRCGLSPNTIRRCLNVLEENGFIKIHTWHEGKKKRNKYYFQLCCWDSGQMHGRAKMSRPRTVKCLDCGETMDRGGYGIGATGKIHYGCGGQVIGLHAISKAKKTDSL